MYPDVLRKHIQKAKKATQKPFGVNVPLLYADLEEILEIIVEEEVKIVFTSAGNPKKWTKYLQDKGITVVHVVSSVKFALKAQAAGVDAIVAEGFEAGGHNGYEETTTMVMIPMIREVTGIPLIAAGGIGSGKAMFAAMALGADGIQAGSVFAAAQESSAHLNFKNKIVESGDGNTHLVLKKLVPVRLIKNPFYEKVKEAEAAGADKDTLARLLGKGRAKKGMFEGDTAEGELEAGQVSVLIRQIKPVAEIMNDLITDFNRTAQKVSGWQF
jgi:enoyl-[acyl-carrier protein] reductase II